MAAKGLAEIVIGLLSLLEAEGLVFRVNALRLARAIVLQIIAFIFGAAALAFFVAAAYKWLATVVSPPLVFCALGAICAAVFFALFWSSSLWTKTKKPGRKAPKSD
ncbi:MAG: hypothetical protein K2H64_06620 [Desulfovibrio sp.]|nr:hypothetical protein [Desulfovibrio sp.]